jgi:hypothetical protein
VPAQVLGVERTIYVRNRLVVAKIGEQPCNTRRIHNDARTATLQQADFSFSNCSATDNQNRLVDKPDEYWQLFHDTSFLRTVATLTAAAISKQYEYGLGI